MEFIDLKAQQLLIKDKIDARIQTVLSHGRYVLGPEVEEVEEVLAKRTNLKHCITTSSGTDSLLIALMALGVGPGDEVITVPYTWISTAEVIALAGAKPVFIDICEDTWNMNPELLEGAISEKTKAIIPVGIYGQPADMTSINSIAEKYNIPVIEDAAQCYGAFHEGKPSGGLSDDLANLMKQIRVHGQKEKHHHPVVGINGRFDSIQAAILLEKITLFDDEIAKRNSVAKKYSDALASSSLKVKPPKVKDENTSVWAQYTLLAENPKQLQERLKSQGIPSVSYYAVPLHLQPVFTSLGYKKGDFPVTENVSARCLSLPMNPYLKDDEVDKVAASFLN